MKPINFISIFALTIVSVEVYSQVYFSVRTGFASNSLNDLEKLQSDVIEASGLDPLTLSEFPSTPFFLFDIERAFSNSMTVGIYLSTTGTGARSGLRDVTGTYQIDQLVNALGIGVSLRFPMTGNFYFGSRIGVVRTKNLLNQKLVLNRRLIFNEKIELTSFGLEMNPHVGLELRLIKRVAFIGEAGLNISLPSDFKYNGQSTNVKANWTGYKIGAGLIFILSKSD